MEVVPEEKRADTTVNAADFQVMGICVCGRGLATTHLALRSASDGAVYGNATMTCGKCQRSYVYMVTQVP